MFKCGTCIYSSPKKYNMRKHINNVHKRDATDAEMTKTQITIEPTEITMVATQNTIKATENTIKNTEITIKNTEITLQNENTNLMTCPKCLKVFKTSHGFKNHHSICKGVSNVLQCHFCHKVFPFQQCKSQHIKFCKIRKAQQQIKELLESESQRTTNIINNTNTNNANNQQIIYNIYNNNYRTPNTRYDCRDSDELEQYENIENINDFGKEDISYISQEAMAEMSKNCDIQQFSWQKHFHPEHPENHNIRINCSKSYKVLRNGQWHIERKHIIHTDIYNKCKSQICSYALSKLLDTADSEQFDEESTIVLQLYNHCDKVCKKRLESYIEIELDCLTKRKYKLQIIAQKMTLEYPNSNLILNVS